VFNGARYEDERGRHLVPAPFGSARDVPRVVAVAVLLADLAVLVLDDVLDTVPGGGVPAVGYRLVLGGVGRTARAGRSSSQSRTTR
jgi:hypothetical protein